MHSECVYHQPSGSCGVVFVIAKHRLVAFKSMNDFLMFFFEIYSFISLIQIFLHQI